MPEETAAKILAKPRWMKITGWSLGILVLVNIVIGIYWSRSPDAFWVNRSIDDDRIVVN